MNANARIPGLTDADAIDLAKTTSTAFSQGLSSTSIAQQLTRFGAYQGAAAKIAGAGLANYCPQYSF